MAGKVVAKDEEESGEDDDDEAAKNKKKKRKKDKEENIKDDHQDEQEQENEEGDKQPKKKKKAKKEKKKRKKTTNWTDSEDEDDANVKSSNPPLKVDKPPSPPLTPPLYKNAASDNFSRPPPSQPEPPRPGANGFWTPPSLPPPGYRGPWPPPAPGMYHPGMAPAPVSFDPYPRPRAPYLPPVHQMDLRQQYYPAAQRPPQLPPLTTQPSSSFAPPNSNDMSPRTPKDIQLDQSSSYDAPVDPRSLRWKFYSPLPQLPDNDEDLIDDDDEKPRKPPPTFDHQPLRPPGQIANSYRPYGPGQPTSMMMSNPAAIAPFQAYATPSLPPPVAQSNALYEQFPSRKQFLNNANKAPPSPDPKYDAKNVAFDTIPVVVNCAKCNQKVASCPETSFSTLAIVLAVVLFVSATPFFFIPLVMPNLKLVKHVCPKCSNVIGRKQPSCFK